MIRVLQKYLPSLLATEVAIKVWQEMSRADLLKESRPVTQPTNQEIDEKSRRMQIGSIALALSLAQANLIKAMSVISEAQATLTELRL